MNRNLATSPRNAGRSRRRTVALGMVLAGTLAAQDRPVSQATSQEMKLTIGRSVVLDRSSDVARISISNPEVMDAVAVTSREILVNAKAAGRSSLVVWSRAGERNMYGVTVEQDMEPIRVLLKETFPGEALDVRAGRDTLALVGRASTQAVAERALALVAPLLKTVVNNLQVLPQSAERQIVLRVKFAEIDRTVANSFGVNLLSTGAGNTPARISTEQFASPAPSAVTGQIGGHPSGTSTSFSISDALNIFAFRPDLNLGAVIQDLETRGVLQILAEPNLVTTNGKEASFLVGGEFPVPVPQAGSAVGAITISFREFGIRLSFTPQVTGNNTIKMHVKPEVSSIDMSNAVVFAGFTVPALSTRRMETDIELGEGQSFVIAGLLDDRVTENLSRVPGLSHIPILGELFKSRSVTKAKTELLVMVTPESVLPLGATDKKPALHMPREFLPVAEGPREPNGKTAGARPSSGAPAGSAGGTGVAKTEATVPAILPTAPGQPAPDAGVKPAAPPATAEPAPDRSCL